MPQFGPHYAHMFAINNSLYQKNVEGLDDERAVQPGIGGGNSAAWIAGHIVWYRRTLLALLGHTVPDITEFEAFKRGAPATPPSGFVPMARVTNLFLEFGVALREELAKVPDERFDEPAPTNLPGCRTVGHVIGFLFMHEAYHIGQLGLARRAAGLPGAIA